MFEQRCVARQAIVDKCGNSFGFELLHRNGYSNAFPKDECLRSYEPTLSVISDHLIGGQCSEESLLNFINFDSTSIFQDWVYLLPPATTVIEVLEQCEPTNQLFSRIKHLKELGYQIALDDFVPQSDWYRFFPFVDFIKLEINQIPIEQCEILIKGMRRFDVQFIAERVETEQQFEASVRVGFDLFQGYFFDKPRVQVRHLPTPNERYVVQLEEWVHANSFNIDEVVNIFQSDPALTYRYLLYLRSVKPYLEFCSLYEAVESLNIDELSGFVTFTLAGKLSTSCSPQLENFIFPSRLLLELSLRCESLRQKYPAGCLHFLALVHRFRQFGYCADNVVSILPVPKSILAVLDSEKSTRARLVKLATECRFLRTEQLEYQCEQLGIGVQELMCSIEATSNWLAQMKGEIQGFYPVGITHENSIEMIVA